MKLANAFTKTVAVLLMLVMCLTPMEALATFWDWGSYEFYNVTTTKIATPRAKSDDDTKWYLTIDNNGYNTMSSTNILGARMNFSLNEDGSERSVASGYHTFSNYVTEYPMKYLYYVKKGDLMVMGVKKDDTSTSSTVLRVSGEFAP